MADHRGGSSGSVQAAPERWRQLMAARRGVALAAVALVALGCDRATPIPAGAQVVNVTFDGATVVLDPATARAGDLYLVVDGPPNASLTFVESKPAADAPAGPLSDADLARLRTGDTERMSLGGFEPGGCDEAQNAQDRGKMGPCGNVMHVVVVPGKYGLVAGGPERDPGSGDVVLVTVLRVTP